MGSLYYTCRDKFELINDKEGRKSQLNSVAHNRSRDSAIDADLQEFETETVDIELVGFLICISLRKNFFKRLLQNLPSFQKSV